MPDDSQPTLAFIYDRHITPTRAVLELRLGLCREYAAEHGWEVAGEWIDEGDAALQSDGRPEFDEMVAQLAEAHLAGRTVLCLVADWNRLSHEAGPCSRLRYKIGRAGGWTETVSGDSDRVPVRRGALEALRDLRPA